MQGPQEPVQPIYQEESEFTFRVLLKKWGGTLRFLVGSWKILLMAGVIGALIGVAYAWYKPVTYTARLSFVVEESKQGGGSIASALAGQFGFDIGSMTGSSGMLAGDNVLELLKSRSLIKKTLLTPVKDSSGISLADEYATAYRLKEKWLNSSKVGRQIDFGTDTKKFTRMQDSLLQSLIKRVVEDELSISKPDKKLNFFELTFTSRNEQLSQLFCERLLKITTDFYIDTKTKRLKNNIDRLQARADSLGGLLDKKTFSAAQAATSLIDINPVYSSPTVSAEISSRNKMIQGTIYGEIVKNLEVSKTSLIQETPTVQIVDDPELPLKRNRLHWAIALLMGAFIGVLLMGFYVASTRQK